MKVIDFFCLSQLRISPLVIGFLSCYVGIAIAETPSAEEFTQSSELILTLSDKWLEPQDGKDSAFQKTNQTANSKSVVAGKAMPKNANIGCKMDVSSLPVTDDSMTSRLEGKCNFDYRY